MIINVIKWMTGTMLIIGALNWGLIGAFDFNIVSFVFGEMSILSRVLYVLIGICGFSYLLLTLRNENTCENYNC